MNPIPYQGTIRLDEYVAAQKILSFRRRLWYRAIIALAALFCLYRSICDHHVAGFYGTLAAYFFVSLTIVSPLLFRYRCRKQFVEYKRLREEMRGFLDEEGFHSDDDRGEPALTKWTRFTKWQTKNGILFLHLNAKLAVTLPHRFFPSDTHADVLKLLSQKIRNNDS